MNRKTYAEKLRDPRWFQFRQEFLGWRRSCRELRDSWCDDCGEDTHGVLHLHHTVYHRHHEPWEYEFEEMRWYCEECHGRIHDLEEDFRNFIRSTEAHICYEFRYMLGALEDAEHKGVLKIALAHAKNAIRNVVENAHANGEVCSLRDRIMKEFGFKDQE